jgi:hypothetical protein
MRPDVYRLGLEILSANGYTGEHKVIHFRVQSPRHPLKPDVEYRVRESDANEAGQCKLGQDVGQSPTKCALTMPLNGIMRRRGRDFSPTEDEILKVITDDWQTKAEIAAACNMRLTSSFSAILTNLVEREWIESSPKGYRFPPLD